MLAEHAQDKAVAYLFSQVGRVGGNDVFLTSMISRCKEGADRCRAPCLGMHKGCAPPCCRHSPA